RGVSNYDSNNAPANTFYSAWNSWVEGELRQPLLQGGGLEFNRIAGPGSTPGVYNGVLIAKINSDINDAEFQVALRDYVSNVENAYWDLYLAFREYDARKKAVTEVEAIYEASLARARGNSDDIEPVFIKQQLMQLKSEVNDALFGKLLTGTQVRNGATGGTLQTGGGVLAAERRLRLLIGRPVNDGMIIRPTEEPTMAEVPFDWETCIQEALVQRPELQKQNVAVKKREMELVAAKNFLNPRLDAVGKYRFRGFGDDLIANGAQGGANAASSLGNLATGQQQEWTVGMELSVPLGFRKAHAAVSHAELNLARERTIQREQQREIVSNLSGAFTDVDRTRQGLRTGLEQYLAAREYVEALRARKHGYSDRRDETDRILDGERKLVQAEVQFFRTRAEYAVALKNVHYEKGSLLTYKDMKIAGQPTATAEMDYEIPSETPPVPESQEAAPQESSASGNPVSEAGSLATSLQTPAERFPLHRLTDSAASEQVGDGAVDVDSAEVRDISDADDTSAEVESDGNRAASANPLRTASVKASELASSIPHIDFGSALNRMSVRQTAATEISEQEAAGESDAVPADLPGGFEPPAFDSEDQALPQIEFNPPATESSETQPAKSAAVRKPVLPFLKRSEQAAEELPRISMESSVEEQSRRSAGFARLDDAPDDAASAGEPTSVDDSTSSTDDISAMESSERQRGVLRKLLPGFRRSGN
ncbi:MAG: TolC family protein, partial [Planctomycetaceae bacterium]|nr:TolC family protein [Planctomycetaceae bacterium]